MKLEEESKSKRKLETLSGASAKKPRLSKIERDREAFMTLAQTIVQSPDFLRELAKAGREYHLALSKYRGRIFRFAQPDIKDPNYTLLFDAVKTENFTELERIIAINSDYLHREYPYSAYFEPECAYSYQDFMRIGGSILAYAIKLGKPPMVNWLLSRGAKFSNADNNWRYLYHAIRSNNCEILKIVLTNLRGLIISCVIYFVIAEVLNFSATNFFPVLFNMDGMLLYNSGRAREYIRMLIWMGVDSLRPLLADENRLLQDLPYLCAHVGFLKNYLIQFCTPEYIEIAVKAIHDIINRDSYIFDRETLNGVPIPTLLLLNAVKYRENKQIIKSTIKLNSAFGSEIFQNVDNIHARNDPHAFRAALRYRSLAAVECLVEYKRSYFLDDWDNMSAFLLWSNSPPIVAYLLDEYASDFKQFLPTKHPVYTALRAGNSTVLEWYLKYDKSTISTWRNSEQGNLLHVAAEIKSLNVFILHELNITIENGLSAKNKAGKTPIDIALDEKNNSFLIYIKLIGAPYHALDYDHLPVMQSDEKLITQNITTTIKEFLFPYLIMRFSPVYKELPLCIYSSIFTYLASTFEQKCLVVAMDYPQATQVVLSMAIPIFYSQRDITVKSLTAIAREEEIQFIAKEIIRLAVSLILPQEQTAFQIIQDGLAAEEKRIAEKVAKIDGVNPKRLAVTLYNEWQCRLFAKPLSTTTGALGSSPQFSVL